jgi:hypothetical protein
MKRGRSVRKGASRLRIGRSIARRGFTTRARPTARIQLAIYRQRKSTRIPKTFRRLLTKNPQEIDRTTRHYLCL